MQALVAGALLAALASGCLSHSSWHTPAAPSAGRWPACVDPWPCGDGSEWPKDLHGPFTIDPTEHVDVASFDGTRLHGWLVKPHAPTGIRLPTVLLSTIYADVGVNPDGTSGDNPDSPTFLSYVYDGPGRALVEAGYVWAIFDVRGVGQSGGCLDPLSPNEQADQAALVDWIAAQPWSNGRVGMMGVSYPGTTPFEAAVKAPPALKAIAVAGTFPDLYIHGGTPQGARTVLYGPLIGAILFGDIALAPPKDSTNPASAQTFAQHVPERACPQVAAMARESTLESWRDDRDGPFWLQRRLTDHFANVTAAVLLAQGYYDGNHFADDEDWALLDQAPKHFIHGPWQHTFPYRVLPDWNATILHWFDFWLKGLGTPQEAGVGVVQYFDQDMTSRMDSAWPPSAAHKEVLYLDGHQLATTAGSAPSSFRLLPTAQGTSDQTPDQVPEDEGENGVVDMLCPASLDNGASVAFASAPLATPLTVAGNPFLALDLATDTAGGQFTVVLAETSPDFACVGPHVQQGARVLSFGAIDLRFANGNFVAQPPTPGQAFHQRVDLFSVAATVKPGDSLVVAIGRGATVDRLAYPPVPGVVQVRADGSAWSSQLVLPVVDGSLGGAAPTLDYPPRPHLPPLDP